MTAAELAEGDDAELIAAWRQGDERAAAELVRRHTASLARFLAAWGPRGDDLDDVVQESFVRAFRGLGGFRGQAAFRTWLFTIGANVMRDAGRRSGRRHPVPLRDDDLPPGSGDPHEEAVAGETMQRLQAAVAELPSMQQKVFLLRAQQGLEYDEIARALGTTPGAARVHYHHAVKRLKEQLT